MIRAWKFTSKNCLVQRLDKNKLCSHCFKSGHFLMPKWGCSAPCHIRICITGTTLPIPLASTSHSQGRVRTWVPPLTSHVRTRKAGNPLENVLWSLFFSKSFVLFFYHFISQSDIYQILSWQVILLEYCLRTSFIHHDCISQFLEFKTKETICSFTLPCNPS